MLKKISIYTLVFYFACLLDANAQSKKPSEMRKERMDKQSSNKVFEDKDAFFKGNDVPEKWKNESAVILAQKHSYEYTADGSSLKFTEITHRKIKLLDKAAIEEFSKFYFYKTSDDYKIGIRLIKANGSVKDISTSDAVKVTSDVPGFFKSSIYGFKVEYNKIAIPDLEVGDIIDFFQEVHGTGVNWTGAAQTLPPIFFTLFDNYPIVKQRYDFVTEKGYFINFKAMNGAPDLVKNTSPDRRTFSFTMEDADRERIKDVRWLYSLRKLPSVKFQVCYAKIGSESEQFLGKVGEPVKSVTPEEIAQKVSYKYFNSLNSASLTIDEVESFMKKKHRDVRDPMEYLKYSYYYLRHMVFMKYNTYKGGYVGDDESVNNDLFVVILRELLKNQKVESRVVVTAPRSISSVDDIIMYDELKWSLLVKNKYVFPFNANSNIFESDDNVETCEAYAIDVSKKEKEVKFEKITIPGSSASDNVLSSVYDVQLDDNMENLKVNSNITAKGFLKSSSVYILKYTDYIDEDYDISGVDRPEEEATRNKTKIAEKERKETARVEEQKKNKLEQMKNTNSDDFKNIVSFDDFSLIESGRSKSKPDLNYTEKFILGDMVKKAGPNYSVDIASLIGSQVDIKAKEKDRDYDVYINYPKTIEYTINLTLPAGYKAEGLEALKFNVDNNTGSFTSSTAMKGDILSISVKKIYKSNFVKKEDWSKMVEFLDAAFNFANKKIILKKK